MAAVFREAPLGQLSRLVLGPRFFTYADERRDFVLPSAKVSSLGKHELGAEDDLEKSPPRERVVPESRSSSNSDFKDNVVDWYGADDADNPQNWSTWKKSFTFFQICLLTFSGQ